jgi:polyisoprenoid-binding protein YceI
MTWNLDTSHSSVEFAVKHMVISSTKGRFTDYDVDADVDLTNLANSKATVRINAASIDTRDEKRDGHLRSADFFDVENNPYITFVSKRLEPKGGDDYKIVGDLTIRGVTKEVVLDGEVTGPVKDPWGGTRVGLSANGKINRKQFGLNWNAALEAGGLLVGDDVKLNIDTELVQAA